MDPRVFAALIQKITVLKDLAASDLEFFVNPDEMSCYQQGKVDAYKIVLEILNRDFKYLAGD